MAEPYAYVLLTIFLWHVQGYQPPNFGLQKKKKLMNRSHSSEVSDKFCELSEDIRAIIKKSNQAKAINFIHSIANQVEQLEPTRYRKSEGHYYQCDIQCQVLGKTACMNDRGSWLYGSIRNEDQKSILQVHLCPTHMVTHLNNHYEQQL